MKDRFEFFSWKGIIALYIIFIIAIATKQCMKSDFKEKSHIGSIDTMTTWIDKENKYHARIKVLETRNVEDFIRLSIKDSEIKQLQKVVYKYRKQLKNQGSVTMFETITKFDTLFSTDTLHDIGLSISDSISNEWIKTKYGFYNRKTFYSLELTNRYSVVVGESSKGWFKKPELFVEVSNDNPYTKTTKLRAYKVESPRARKFGVGVGIGYGINSSLQVSPYVGVGVQYNLIRF